MSSKIDIDFKNIHIGDIIRQVVEDRAINPNRITSFFKTSDDEIFEMYKSDSLPSHIILRWCKLLEYDLFRLYTQHLILYSPQSLRKTKENEPLPEFRKNIYTAEIINFIIELIRTGEKTRQQVIEDYDIPKTTLYNWLSKYNRKTEQR
ncbi:transposase [Chryseobacterium shigense]|uniref:Uncharacterized protein n=1 Tax=Chryseobacterium shigense TaxID=297244 RepID=A0A841NC85_9FLAO|nr:transposase [Chryseobacterium shigense]MBB6369642.1 hypothetical protein [Chryseobacterium shigense]